MAERRIKRFLALAGLGACALPGLASGSDAGAGETRGWVDFLNSARVMLQDGGTRLESMLRDRFQALSRDTPDWLREQTRGGLDDAWSHPADSVQLVVQQDRRDGTDLLTLRYPIGSMGALHTYAGAGINQAEYYAGSTRDASPDLVSRSNRHRSVGGAAELGAELRLSSRMMLNADVRWVELDPGASLLRASDGLVGADPLSVGLSLGWRFR